MNGSATVANMRDDINNIILGNITSNTSANGSGGWDSGNSIFYGTYPSGIYTLANNAGSFTYQKVHNANSSVNCYFTFGISGSYGAPTGIANLTLGYGYTASTNVYTQSNTYIFPTALTPVSYAPIDIIVNNNCFLINQPSTGVYGIGVFDLGYNGISQAFATNMINAYIPFYDFEGIPTGSNPYSYNLANSGYGAANLSLSYTNPFPQPYSAAGNVAILENPVFCTSALHSNTISLVYGLNKIIEGQYTNRAIYADSTPTYRYVVTSNNTSFSITIS